MGKGRQGRRSKQGCGRQVGRGIDARKGSRLGGRAVKEGLQCGDAW